MSSNRYLRVAQLGAGRDAIAYRAFDPVRGEPIELRILHGASAQYERWTPLMRRLRLAASFRHASALPVLDLHLDEEPATLALPWCENTPLTAALGPALPLPLPEVVALGHQLAEVLAAAHRFCLTHGALHPSRFAGASRRTGCVSCRVLATRPKTGGTSPDDGKSYCRCSERPIVNRISRIGCGCGDRFSRTVQG